MHSIDQGHTDAPRYVRYSSLPWQRVEKQENALHAEIAGYVLYMMLCKMAK